MSARSIHYPDGLTVRELRELLRDWPDEDELGEESEVWVETGQNRSSQVTSIWKLNGSDLLVGLPDDEPPQGPQGPQGPPRRFTLARILGTAR